MKMTAYIRFVEKHDTVNKGLFRRAAEKILGKSEEERVYTYSYIYDERLVKIGVLVNYYYDKKDGEDNLYSDIQDICRETGCVKIALEDYSLTEYFPWEHYDGTEEILSTQLENLKNDETFDGSLFVGVVVSEKTDISFVRCIADTFRYVMIYSVNRAVAMDIGDSIMKYNSMATVITDRREVLYTCDAIINLDSKNTASFTNFKGKHLNPYLRFNEQQEDMLYKAYTDKFDVITLSAAFKEAFYADL